MERLTNRIKQLDKDDLIVYTKGKYEDTVPGEMSHDDIRAVLKKLAYYEDTEEEREQLDKALNELKRRREYDGYLLGSGIVESAYSSGYKKAVDDAVCEWKGKEKEYIQNPHTKRLYSNEESVENVYCNTCGKKIKVVE